MAGGALFLLLAATSLQLAGCQGRNATDTDLLLAIKASFTNGEEVLGATWRNGTEPCRGAGQSDWVGVACDGSWRVSAM